MINKGLLTIVQGFRVQDLQCWVSEFCSCSWRVGVAVEG